MGWIQALMVVIWPVYILAAVAIILKFSSKRKEIREERRKIDAEIQHAADETVLVDTETLYRNLTGVNVLLQWAQNDERGKGYYGEYLVFRKLFLNTPGRGKILMNLQIPVDSGKTTEIDLLLIHETGLCVFEIKHYKGTVYGKPNEETWMQYFRTASDHLFRNPVLQNEYHIQALKKMFPGLPMQSFVVFSNNECKLQAELDCSDVHVCMLDELNAVFHSAVAYKPAILTGEQIDNLFNELLPYAPVMQSPVASDGEAEPLWKYFEHIHTAVADLKRDSETYLTAQKEKLQKAFQKKAKLERSAAILTGVLCVLLSLGAVGTIQAVCERKTLQAQAEASAARSELETFKQKFEYVPEFNNGDLYIPENLVTVSDVVLTESANFENAVDFSCLLTWNGKNNNVHIKKDAKLVVMLEDGAIREYDLFNESYPSTDGVKLDAYDKQGRIAVHEFYDIRPREITYIKLMGVSICRYMSGRYVDIVSNYEIELYRAR